MTDRVSPSLVIVDDHELFRQGLQALLAPDFEIVGFGGTSGDAVRLCQELDPDLLLLDVELGCDPAETTIRTVRRNSPGIVIVILTMFDDAVLQRRLLQAGASDYVTKSISHQDLADRIVTALLAGPATTRPVDSLPPGLLSPRELEVLRLVAAASSNREIARHLVISEGTAKRHISNIYAKLGAVSRIDAVAKAALFGLL